MLDRVIYPDGMEGFQANCGVRMQGGAFRSPSMCTKHSFRLLFKGVYGPTKLRYPLFGDDAAGEFDTIVLRAGANDGYAWSGNETNAQYTRDQFMRDLQLGTGQRRLARPVRAPLRQRPVLGAVQSVRAAGREPSPAATTAARRKTGTRSSTRTSPSAQGDRTALNQMLSLCQEAGKSYEALMKLQGKGLDGAVRPDYPCLLDLSNYVDYMIVNLWGGNWDWPWNNYWLGRDRTAASTGFKFYCWDAEDVLLTSRSPLSINMLADSKIGSEVGQPHARLKENPEYRMFFADRIHRLFFNGGILTPDAAGRTIYSDWPARSRRRSSPKPPAGATSTAGISRRRTGSRCGTGFSTRTCRSVRTSCSAISEPRDSIRTSTPPSSTSTASTSTAGTFSSTDVSCHAGRQRHLLHPRRQPTLESPSRRPRRRRHGRQSSSRRTPPSGCSSRRAPSTTPGEAAEPSTTPAGSAGAGGVGFERSTGYEHLFLINLVEPMYAKQTTCCLRIPFTLDRDPATLAGVAVAGPLRRRFRRLAQRRGSGPPQLRRRARMELGGERPELRHRRDQPRGHQPAGRPRSTSGPARTSWPSRR